MPLMTRATVDTFAFMALPVVPCALALFVAATHEPATEKAARVNVLRGDAALLLSERNKDGAAKLFAKAWKMERSEPSLVPCSHYDLAKLRASAGDTAGAEAILGAGLEVLRQTERRESGEKSIIARTETMQALALLGELEVKGRKLRKAESRFTAAFLESNLADSIRRVSGMSSLKTAARGLVQTHSGDRPSTVLPDRLAELGEADRSLALGLVESVIYQSRTERTSWIQVVEKCVEATSDSSKVASLLEAYALKPESPSIKAQRFKRAADYAFKQGYVASARRFLTQAIALRTRHEPVNWIAVAELHSKLCLVLWALNDADGAIAARRAALAAAAHVLTPDELATSKMAVESGFEDLAPYKGAPVVFEDFLVSKFTTENCIAAPYSVRLFAETLINYQKSSGRFQDAEAASRKVLAAFRSTQRQQRCGRVLCLGMESILLRRTEGQREANLALAQKAARLLREFEHIVAPDDDALTCCRGLQRLCEAEQELADGRLYRARQSAREAATITALAPWARIAAYQFQFATMRLPAERRLLESTLAEFKGVLDSQPSAGNDLASRAGAIIEQQRKRLGRN